MAWANMVNMELSDEDKLDLQLPAAVSEAPEFPWGLRITLTHRELEKLGLEADCPVGATIDLRALAKVCSVSRNDGPMGPEDRVELQITDLAVENEEEPE
jgi:hypothetical protein